MPIPVGGEAHVAETTIVAGRRGNKRKIRVVVRRTRLTDETQGELWPHWRYHAFITNRTDLDPIAADKYHRQHATVELAIRDLKASTGLAHLPSGSFAANAAWLTCAALAHNLYRWINHHTGRRRNGKLTVGQTVRNQLLALPGRLVNHAGRTILRLPARWRLGTHLPHHRGEHPRPAPTLLNPPITPTPAAPHRPHAPRTNPSRTPRSPTPPNRPKPAIQTPRTARPTRQAVPNTAKPTPNGGFRLRGRADRC